MSQIVAIVGRPNVGKSTLFNRLIGERKSIIDNVSGVTRDRIYGFSDWNGKNFTVVDTGGFVKNSSDIFEAEIRRQVQIAIDEATVIVFVVDVTTGITDLDEEIAGILRKNPKKVILAVNKVDNAQRQMLANEFWSLGFNDTVFISSISGGGTGELLDMVADVLPENISEESDTQDNEIAKIAIVGQPNVGKSSMTNALMGEERNIVTDIPGTTRDAIYALYNKFDKKFYLIDTAGIRKKAKVHEDLEFYSVIRAIKAIEEADVCLLMLDATVGIESQDLSILGLIQKRKKGLVILVNKWDLIQKETNTARDFEKSLKEKIAPFTDVPILFTSVLDKQRIFKTVETALQIHENRKQKIKTSVLNDVMLDVIEKNPPPSHRGKYIKIKYVTQLPVYYPSFVFYCNYPDHVKPSYRNFIENQLRKNFTLTGVSISVYFREK
ncbi:MAG: ribosome biogenesis GTPase Der [Saprospiraceae bacterium]|nr:ribosome biogenesis GTPase Der [Saprospiraceae bacterium]MBK8887051.1 ribosome biogenesis GTPase Der [Saprospiraceae bacterium]MBP8213262.1 ribosome biogenesis GTPase Der [Saprospiraceae bacterium]HQV66035.1 ribosome biogenesis GTPase Der [Saprospiraceae bacterium]